MKRLCVVAAFLAFGLGAAQASPQDDLMAADRAFSKLSVVKGRNYAFLAYVANNGRLFGTGDEPPMFGRAQAFRRLAHGRGRGVLSWTPEVAGVSEDGKLGWTDGHWLYTVKESKTRATGHYLTVWVKDRRGAWKVQADMGTSDPAPKK